MKKLLLFFLSLYCVLGLLSSCAAGPAAAPNGKASPSDSAISLTSSLYGTNNTISSTEGFYQLSPNPQKGSNLIYTDYASQSTVYLCNRPECLHNDDTCPSWFPFATGSLFLDAGQRHLFCVGNANSADADWEIIWKMDANGNNREKFYSCLANELLTDAVASDAEYLYFATSIVDRETRTLEKELKKVNIDTGETTPLLTYGASDWLYGAFDDQLILLYFDGATFRYTTYCPATGEQRPFYSYDYLTDEPGTCALARPNGHNLLILEPAAQGTANITRMDIRTGDTVPLCSGVPYFGADTTFVQDFIGRYMVINTSDTTANDPDKIERYYYLVDCETGDIAQPSLTFPWGDIEKFVEIAADAGEYFLVASGTEIVPMMLNGPDHTFYEASIGMMTYSLIKKNDYWNGNPVYIPLDTSALKRSA